MSPRFASDALPYAVIFATTATLAAVTYLAWMAWKHHDRNPVPLRVRFRELRRLAWYRLTRLLSRRCSMPATSLDPEDAIEFGKLAGLYKQRGIYADDPQSERRRT